MRRLLTLLGKGQARLTELSDRTYKTAEYFRRDTQNRIKTPFFAEALIQLYSPQFEIVHIFGTDDSMWETLLVHSIDNSSTPEDEEVFAQLTSQNRHITTEILTYIAERFRQKHHAHIREVKCTLIPIGQTDDEIWKIFESIANTCEEGDVVSIDITHGLRYQSAFVLLAGVMLRTVKNITIENIFYGGFELAQPAPILELKPLVEILDWTLAINDFQSYSNAKKLVELLSDKHLTQALSTFSTALQINDSQRVGQEAKGIQNYFADSKHQQALPPPAKLLLPFLQKLPQMLAAETKEWARYLKIARWQFEHEQLGLAILSAWEAIICRIAELLSISNYENNQKLYAELSRIARAREPYQYLADLYSRFNLTDFYRNAEQLNTFRKAIAHADTLPNLSLQDLRAKYRQILGFFEQHLGNAELSKVFSQEVVQTIKNTSTQNNV
ncbi:MAG: TIGR02221 family CRISPR-associated protein [Candidatus Thermochlorobacter aerophilum]|jgi:CRISPR-associated Csx2 family protein|uniref:TIGR02221 family CRISPR-associated protein n=1 Tax=Candidatus Thermochlorobacter aerophilus TaxID=1868324 RepID=A0A395M084_9BACT|nr:MAG: TIGR02221 family CRISPR-associated protein [Candidatus Thermochlorobacter aerophilum]